MVVGRGHCGEIWIHVGGRRAGMKEGKRGWMSRREKGGVSRSAGI